MPDKMLKQQLDSTCLELSMENICFGYHEQLILDRISLGLMKGSFISIVGPNGSGKSTLLRLMSSVLKPDSGLVVLDGLNINQMDRKAIATKLSFVPQTVPSEVEFSCFEVVMMGRYPHIQKLKGETEHDRNVATEAMKTTNTLAFKDRPMRTLSGGERQRVILAQALAQEPSLLLLDEPVSSLDLQHQVEMLNLLKRLCVDRGITVVAILHDLNMATTYSDFVMMLKDKQIAAQGLPGDIFTVERIYEVFGIHVSISLSPVSHRPYIYTMTHSAPKQNGVTVHVICGGGSGTELLKKLHTEGFTVTTGVLPVGDMDWKTSRDLNLTFIDEAPFSDISREAYEKNIELAQQADCILVAPVYFGKANRGNCVMLLEPILEKKKFILWDSEHQKDRDFIGGEAVTVYEKLLKSNRDVIPINVSEDFDFAKLLPSEKEVLYEK